MDDKHTPLDSRRLSLVQTDKNNAVTTRRSRTREVRSRYRSPSPSTPVPQRSSSPSTPAHQRSPSPSTPGPRRSPSPNLTRKAPSHSQSVQKRAISAERKRPTTPPSPLSPFTPVKDSYVDTNLPSRRLSTGGIPNSLWPSTMRSLNVSFQSDTISVPVSKKEKPAGNSSSDRTLKPSSNMASKQAERHSMLRKATPERKRSPLKGRNASDQSENAKPIDGLSSRLIDQHRWPSRIGGKVTSNPLAKSIDLSDKSSKMFPITAPGIGFLSLRRMSISEGLSKPLQKSSSDASRRLSLDEISRPVSAARSADDNTLRSVGAHKGLSMSSSDRMTLALPAVRYQSLPSPNSRPSSPSRISLSSSSRGVSPSRSRPSTPPSRGLSPSKMRASSNQSDSSTSVLSFIADVKKGKKGASYVEDAYNLRLMHNRYLQWRFTNAQAEDVLYIQKLTAEEALYNVWNDTLSLWDSIISKRITLQQLQLELKLNSVLDGQMMFLDDWGLLEKDHISSLVGAAEDLEASTLRLPVTRGARVDIESLKTAMTSAVDVMQAMGLSMSSLLSRVEEMNSLVYELAVIAVEETLMLDECEALLGRTTAIQVEEYSLRSHIMYMKHSLEEE